MDALALIVSGIVAIWGIYQTFVTSKLQQDVHRLSVRLDQSIQRLERARDLINNMCMAWEDFGNALDVKEQYGEDDLVNVLTVNRVSRIELYALANVIGDREFFDILEELDRALLDIDSKKISPGKTQEVLKWLRRLEEHFEKLHERVYELLEDAIREQKR